MDSSQEALFKDMLAHSWFIASEGDVESPTGYFGYVHNEKAELEEIYQAFDHTVEAYGKPEDDEILGAWVAWINSDGIIYIYGQDSVEEAKAWFDKQVEEFNNWNDQDSDDV